MTENASVITLPWGYKPPATFRLFDSYCIPEESVFEFTEEMVSQFNERLSGQNILNKTHIMVTNTITGGAYPSNLCEYVKDVIDFDLDKIGLHLTMVKDSFGDALLNRTKKGNINQYNVDIPNFILPYNFGIDSDFPMNICIVSDLRYPSGLGRCNAFNFTLSYMRIHIPN